MGPVDEEWSSPREEERSISQAWTLLATDNGTGMGAELALQWWQVSQVSKAIGLSHSTSSSASGRSGSRDL
jgi:hypothetical protein